MKATLFDQLLSTLSERFAKNMPRHMGLDWSFIDAKLKSSAGKLQTLFERCRILLRSQRLSRSTQG